MFLTCDMLFFQGIKKFVNTTSANQVGQVQPVILHNSFGPRPRNSDSVGRPEMKVVSHVTMWQGVIVLEETSITDLMTT